MFAFLKLCILATFQCSALGRAQLTGFESAPAGWHSPLTVCTEITAFVQAGNKSNVSPALYLTALGRSAKQEGVGEACTALNGFKSKLPQSCIVPPTTPFEHLFVCEWHSSEQLSTNTVMY